MLSAVGQAICCLDPRGRIVYWNLASEALFGWTAEEVDGMDVFDLFPSNGSRYAAEDVMGFLAAGGEWSIDMNLVRRDGSSFPGLITGTPLRDEDGAVTGTVASCTDLTRLKEAEDALAASERRYRALVEHAEELICVVDRDLRIVYLSPSAIRHFGYDEVEDPAAQASGAEYVHPDDIEMAYRLLADLLEAPGRKRALVESLRVRKADGSYRIMEGTLTNLVDDPAVGGIVVNIRDVTERREAEDRYLGLLEKAPDGIAVTTADSIVYANPAAARLLGATSTEELIGLDGRSYLHHEDLQRLRDLSQGPEQVDLASGSWEVRLVRPDQQLVPCLLTLIPITWQGEEATQVLMKDLTGQRHAEEETKATQDALAQRERFHREVLDSMTTETAVLDSRGVILAVNEAWRRLGTEVGGDLARGAEGTNYLETCRTNDAISAPTMLAEGISGVLSGARSELHLDIASRTPLGPRWYAISAVPLTSGAGDAVLTLMEITARKSFESELSHRATHDPLTGLPNRVVLLDRLTHAIDRAMRKPWSLAVLFLDVDDFKLVNDSYGHPAGDDVLVAVAERLRQCVRPGDTVARFAGDEFVVVCEDLSSGEASATRRLGEAQATTMADRLQRALAQPFAIKGPDGPVEIELGASIGIALLGAERVHPEALLQDADAAMFTAKSQGRGGYALSDHEARARSRARLETTKALRNALRSGEMDLHYQPLVNIRTGEACGAEALMRWNHPGVGMVAPAEFIPVAEDSGLIVPLGSWVLAEACSRAAGWDGAAAHSPLSISVNLSTRQLGDAGLVEDVRDALAGPRLEPSLLWLEITESVMMTSPDQAVRTLRELKDIGVRLAIDDFGTGYSSLEYLKQFPVDFLKIDRSFVDGLGRDSDDEKIVAAIINLAEAFELSVIAEGVETEDQLQQLADLGCELAQGYHFAKPARAPQFEVWLAEHRWARRRHTDEASLLRRS